MAHLEIIPAILAQTPTDFFDKVRSIQSCSPRLHLDIIDGNFAPNTTISGFEELVHVDSSIRWNVHLMVNSPELDIEKWFLLNVDRIYIHVQALGTDFMPDLLKKIQTGGKKAGLVFQPGVLIEAYEHLVPLADAVQCMTVHPGFYGSPFEAEGLEQLAYLKTKYPNIHYSVDGSMNPETISRAVAAGADAIIVGSYIMNSKNPCQRLQELKTLIQSLHV